MRRLSMKNRRRKSETASNSEPEENGGARAASDDTDNDETQAGRHNNARKSVAKKRSLRSGLIQKPKTQTDQDTETEDTIAAAAGESEESEERENGEKMAAAQKPLPNKRRKKEDQRASTSTHDKSEVEDEYEVERLINLRTIKGRRQFLVRWKGYGESADTWENEKDLNCPELIENFIIEEKEKEVQPPKMAKTDKSKRSRNISKKQTENEEENIKDDKEVSKEFEVEKIIEVRFKKNGTKDFLIRWKGFSTADDSWEPEKNLNCPELIVKFMQKVEKAKISEMRELRTNRAHTKRYTLTTYDSGRRLSKRNRNKQRATYHECDE